MPEMSSSSQVLSEELQALITEFGFGLRWQWCCRTRTQTCACNRANPYPNPGTRNHATTH